MHTEKGLRAEFAYHLFSPFGCIVKSNVTTRVFYFFFGKLIFQHGSSDKPHAFPFPQYM